MVLSPPNYVSYNTVWLRVYVNVAIYVLHVACFEMWLILRRVWATILLNGLYQAVFVGNLVFMSVFWFLHLFQIGTTFI